MKKTQSLNLIASLLLLISVTITLLEHWLELAVWLSVIPFILLPIVIVLYIIAIIRIVRSKKK